MSKWKALVDYINNIEFNEIITRKEFIKNLDDSFSEQYVLLIKHAGFIEKVKIATYKKKYNIPDFIKTNDIVKMAYDNNYKFKIMRKIKLCHITQISNTITSYENKF